MAAPMQHDFDEVRATSLMKTYGATRALAGVSLRLASGTITAILGPNGSGKSTLLQILAGLVRPTRGEVRYGEHRIDAVRGRVSVLAHAPMLYPDLTTRENLRLVAALHGRGEADITRVIESLSLGAFLDRPVRVQSRGQLQRSSLARALVPDPKLILLDEPSTGLDSASTDALTQTMRTLRDRGRIVVVITHDHSLAASIADVTLRIERGRLASPEAA